MKKRHFINLFAISVMLLSISIGIYGLQNVTSFFGKAGGQPANLVIDSATSYTTSFDAWRHLSQGGEEKTNMLSSVTAQVKKINPSYIRIDHIYDFYNVVQRSGGSLTFNWSELDQVVGSIKATGATPFLSLSYMPLAISKSNEVDLPANWGEWEIVVQKTIEHFSSVSGGTDGVYYEVWNEPDLFGDFKTYGQKNYLELYLHAARGAERAQGVKSFKFGGPATTALYENWFNGFFKYANDNNLRVDFYSWHRYSKEIDDYNDDVLKAQRWLYETFPKYRATELLITEAGPNSEVDTIYDSEVAAIHTLSTATVGENTSARIFSFEVKDGPGASKFWGRWGLLTHDKFGTPEIKPRYKAFEFLESMRGGKISVAGQGSWVRGFGRRDANTLRLLVVNYDVNGKHVEAVPLTFINLPQKTFIFKRKDFLGAERSTPIATDEATWQKVEYFKPNSAAIFELTF